MMISGDKQNGCTVQQTSADAHCSVLTCSKEHYFCAYSKNYFCAYSKNYFCAYSKNYFCAYSKNYFCAYSKNYFCAYSKNYFCACSKNYFVQFHANVCLPIVKQTHTDKQEMLTSCIQQH